MAGASEQWPLVGRSEELAMLDEHVGGQSGAMVLAGAVGVGKSRLLAGWLSSQEARGRTTVVVRATKSTATIPFGAFARWVAGRLGDTHDRLGILQATAQRLAHLGPDLVVAVDDAHLLDDGSAALVLHVVQHTRSCVLVTVRSGEPCPDAVVALWKERLAPRLELQPLSEPETVELVEHLLGDSVAETARRRLWQVTGGNPFYLGEVVEAGQTQGVLTRSASGWEWRGVLAGSSRLVELVSDRIGARGSTERRLLEIVALGEPLPLEVLTRLAPRSLLAQLEYQGLIVAERPSPQDAGRVVRLAHPLYSEVLRAELSAFVAEGHHLALAEAAIAAGAQQREPLRVATWLLGSGGEAADPDLFLQASYLALVVNDYELAARLAAAAEEAGGGWRATVRRAQALGPLQRWDEVDGLLSALSASDNEPEARAAAVQVRAEQSFWHRGADLASARAALAEAAELVPAAARSPLLTEQAHLSMMAFDLDEAIRLATLAAADAVAPLDRLNAIACAGRAAVLLGRTTDALAVVEMAAPYALEVVHTDPVAGGFLASIYSYASVLDGRIDEAAELFAFLCEQDVVRMGGPARALPSVLLARAALAQGRLDTATRLCREALGDLGDANHFETGVWVAATMATAAAQAADVDTAGRAVAWIDAHSRVQDGPDGLFTDLSRAWLAASRAELSAAQDLALAVAGQAGAAGVWLVEMTALLDATRLGAARTTAARLQELTSVVEGPYAATAAPFAQALATRDGDGLDQAANDFAVLGARLLAAEAAAAAADVHAEAGQRRRHAASLAHAQQLASMCESAATPLLARLDQAPVATALTAREREVAELAARGHSNREIAETLIVSVRTVDSHLNHAYTKLGIDDRSRLAAILGHQTRA